MPKTTKMNQVTPTKRPHWKGRFSGIVKSANLGDVIIASTVDTAPPHAYTPKTQPNAEADVPVVRSLFDVSRTAGVILSNGTWKKRKNRSDRRLRISSTSKYLIRTVPMMMMTGQTLKRKKITEQMRSIFRSTM